MKSIILVAAILILAGAFPVQAHQIIDYAAGWLHTITTTITPGQQTAVLIAVVLAVLFSVKN